MGVGRWRLRLADKKHQKIDPFHAHGQLLRVAQETCCMQQTSHTHIQCIRNSREIAAMLHIYKTYTDAYIDT